MNFHDLILIAAGACLAVAGFLVAVALGFAVTGVVLAAAWFLLGDA